MSDVSALYAAPLPIVIERNTTTIIYIFGVFFPIFFCCFGIIGWRYRRKIKKKLREARRQMQEAREREGALKNAMDSAGFALAPIAGGTRFVMRRGGTVGRCYSPIRSQTAQGQRHLQSSDQSGESSRAAYCRCFT